ncbi:MAG: YlxR family protein [Clostridia bacterium]|nr:YlxR family protein [Clostridia bacterium]MDD4376284.1 YlxR family protein [Clostridia bacterium]
MKFTRMCIACRKKENKNNLLRFVTYDGEVILDKEQKVNARAIYLCKDNKCIFRLLKAKDIKKVTKGKIDEKKLIKAINELEDM